MTKLRLEKLASKIEDSKNKLEENSANINDLQNRNDQFNLLSQKFNNRYIDDFNSNKSRLNQNKTDNDNDNYNIYASINKNKPNENESQLQNSNPNLKILDNNNLDLKDIHSDVVENLFKDKRDSNLNKNINSDYFSINNDFLKKKFSEYDKKETFDNNMNSERNLKEVKCLKDKDNDSFHKLKSNPQINFNEIKTERHNLLHKKAISAIDIRINLQDNNLNIEDKLTSNQIMNDYILTKINSENGIKKTINDSLNSLKLHHNDIEYNYCYLVKAISKILLKPKDIVLIRYK